MNTKRKSKSARTTFEATLVKRFSARFERHVTSEPLIDANALGCALNIDEDGARQMINAGVFRKTVRGPYSYSVEKVPRAELIRFLEIHGRRWFTDRLDVLIGGFKFSSESQA